MWYSILSPESARSGLAASRNGRGFFCIERDADYDQIARARIKKAV